MTMQEYADQLGLSFKEFAERIQFEYDLSEPPTNPNQEFTNFLESL